MELLTIRGQSPVILLVDLQGFEFVSDGVFIVEEAVVTNVKSLGEYHHWLFNPPHSKGVLDLADWRTLEYGSYHHHGLQWDDGLIPYDRVAHYFERVLRSECKQDRNVRIYVSDHTECLLKLCDHKLDGDHHLEVNGIRRDDSYTENEEDPISKHDYPELKKSEIMKNSFQKHEAYSIGFYYHDRYEEDQYFYDKFRGLNCVRKFAERLKEVAIQIQKVTVQKSNIL
ncbi:hypothetical protein QAD02_013943 [Eretmocerus hayati]|uniref:Uncharacterized protein n=1 Tax=Eretmocerus hayati TaxID=131215 RepID=A0ACC2P3Z2_9HYME|nr:hypothetical protein QAD02_013943 [Eretmocerus hayati]